MKRFCLLLVHLAAILLLTACITTEPVIQKVPVYQWALPSDQLIVNCEVQAPPFTPDTIGLLTPDEVEKQSFAYISSLHLSIMVCNKTIDSIRDWKADKAKSDPPQP